MRQLESGAPPHRDATATGETWRLLLGLAAQGRFWLIALALFSAAVVDQALIQHQVLYLEVDLGMTPGVVAAGISTMGLVGIVARLFVGGVFDRLSVRGVSLMYLALAGSAMLALFALNPLVFATFIVLRAVGHAAVLLDSAVLSKHVFGFRNLGLLLGVYTSFVAIGFALGPWLVGRLYRISGSYLLPFVVCAALAVFAALVLLPVKPEHRLAGRQGGTADNPGFGGQKPGLRQGLEIGRRRPGRQRRASRCDTFKIPFQESRTMNNNLIWRSVRYAAVAAAAIAVTGSALAQDELPATFDGLELVENSRAAATYVSPDADFSQYDQVMLLDSYVAFRKDWKKDYNRDAVTLSQRVSDQDMERIKQGMAELFKEVFVEEITRDDGYKMSDTAGENVLLVRPAIIDLDVTAPDTQSASRSYTFVDSAGAATLYIELYDSVSGDILARSIDRREGRDYGRMQWNSSVANRSEARRILRQWAGWLREGLDEVHGKGD